MAFKTRVLYVGKILFIVCFLLKPAFTLKCKCTQSSASIQCVNGICDVPSSPAACLMLNHQTTGIHYACSGSQLPDGDCQHRVTKSGATVKVCSCSSADFCNQNLWPSSKEEAKTGLDSKGLPQTESTTSVASKASFFSTFHFLSTVFCRLLFNLL